LFGIVLIGLLIVVLSFKIDSTGKDFGGDASLRFGKARIEYGIRIAKDQSII